MNMKRLAIVLFVMSAATAFAADNPWVGNWKPDPVRSNFVEVDDTLIISSPAEGVLRWEYRTIKFEMEGKPDGSEMHITYPSKPNNLTETVTLLTPRKLSYSVKIDGKVIQEGTDEVSADGKTLTAVSRRLDKKSRTRIE